MKEKIEALLKRCRETEGPIPVTEAEMEELQAVFSAMDPKDPSVRMVMRYLFSRLVLIEE